jgi:hypothetical protein
MHVEWLAVICSLLLELDTPHAPARANTKPVPALRRQHALRSKTDVANFILAAPARAGTLGWDIACVGTVAVDAGQHGLVFLVDQVPGHDERVVAA